MPKKSKLSLLKTLLGQEITTIIKSDKLDKCSPYGNVYLKTDSVIIIVGNFVQWKTCLSTLLINCMNTEITEKYLILLKKKPKTIRNLSAYMKCEGISLLTVDLNISTIDSDTEESENEELEESDIEELEESDIEEEILTPLHNKLTIMVNKISQNMSKAISSGILNDSSVEPKSDTKQSVELKPETKQSKQSKQSKPTFYNKQGFPIYTKNKKTYKWPEKLPAKWLDKTFGKKIDKRKVFLNEKQAQVYLKYYTGGKREKPGSFGRADLLIKDKIIEIKNANLWHQAVGQIRAYSYFYPEHQQCIYLFNATSKLDRKLVKAVCEYFEIEIEYVEEMEFSGPLPKTKFTSKDSHEFFPKTYDEIIAIYYTKAKNVEKSNVLIQKSAD